VAACWERRTIPL